MKPKFFRSPVHCAKLANDGLLYVCDRGNNRVQIFNAAEDRGGVEFYLIEQEGSRFSELETAQRCLTAYKQMRAT